MARLQHFAFLMLIVVFTSIYLPANADAHSKQKPSISALSPNSGTPGQTLTITGENLGNKPGKILLGGKRLNKSAVGSWNNQQVTLTLPQGSGSISVRLVTRAKKKSNALEFQYQTGNNSGGGGTTTDLAFFRNFKLLANNDLGMHCVDKDFTVFSILPPFNVVNAQVIAQDAAGKPHVLNSSTLQLRYSPVADSQGSINSSSLHKTNFWDTAANSDKSNAELLYGAALAEGQGLLGLYMPSDTQDDNLRSLTWNSSLNLFSATGIPILPSDDNGNNNPYPMLRISAYDKNNPNVELAFTDIVVPVSDETTCSNCHATGKKAAQGQNWSNATDLEVQTRSNILRLHDNRHRTALQANQPVLCAGCHYSPALDLAGNGRPTGNQVGHKWMSEVMHAYHAGNKISQVDGKTIYDQPAPVAGLDPSLNGVPAPDQQACYQCHPGTETKCLRGAMTDTVTCQNCHGGMQAVGAVNNLTTYGTIDKRTTDLKRKAWSDEPRCQSCHTGDAVKHLIPASAKPAINAGLASDGIRLLHAYDRNDPAASPLLAGNKRFAENDGKLFRFSKGHSGIACEGCHGSTHAIWPGDTAHPNDDITATDLQGHVGTISECSTCHKSGSLAPTLAGPHGMHNVGDSRWALDEDRGHPAFYQRQPGECKACHGQTLRGTVLSRAAADRTWNTEWGTKTVKRGEPVGCYTCHNGPDDD